MTETPDSPETPPEDDLLLDDLQSLMGGLDFTPDWAKEEPGVKKSSPSYESRDHSRGSGPRAPRKSSRERLQGVRVKPRRDAAPGGGGGGTRDWDNRSYDSNSGNRGGRDDRRDRPPRPPRLPVHVDFIPDKKRLSMVVAVIRKTRRVFPLNVVASRFMENPAFLSIKYTVKKQDEADRDFELAVCKANGMVFSERSACEAYILEHGLEEYYESQVREVDPPKGSFPGVGRHSKSNRLIGPPNWHGYQARMEEVRQEVDPGCPPDIFARQVELVREEEVIEEWKKEVSQVVFYRRRKTEESSSSTDPVVKSSSEIQAEPAPSAEPEASAEQQAPSEPEAPAEPETTADPETSAEPTPPAEPEASSEPEAPETPAEPEASSEPAPPAEPDDRPFDLSREQVESEFKTEVLPKLIKMTQRAIMPGALMEKMTDPSLLSSTRFHLSREAERPNSIIFALRPAFKHMRLHVFRHDGQLMASSVEPHPLPEGLKVTPQIQQILDYVAEHPLCHTKEALEAVAKLTQELTPDLVSHFRWLIEKGHLIEFHDEKLLLPSAKGGKKE